MRNLPILLFLGVAVFLASCQKELSSDGLALPDCKLEKIYYYSGSTTIDDSVSYEYSNGKISKVQYIDYYATIMFNGDKIGKKLYFDNGQTTSFGYEEYTYNSNGNLTRADYYITSPSFPTPYLYDRTDLVWNAGKLQSLVYLGDTSATGTGPDPLVEYTYTYNGENIDRTITNDLVSQVKDTLYFSHDANLNYYLKSPQLLLTDRIFNGLDGSLLPLGLSLNNVTSISGTNFGTLPLTYEENDQGNIKELKASNFPAARYMYKCQ